MAEQGGFDFTVPVEDVTRVTASGRALPPVSGRSASARHASYTGAAAMVRTWARRQSEYLQLLRNAGALSDQEAAAILKWQLCSVNSVRNSIERTCKKRGRPPMLRADGFETHTFVGDGGETHTTRRTRWRLIA